MIGGLHPTLFPKNLLAGSYWTDLREGVNHGIS